MKNSPGRCLAIAMLPTLALMGVARADDLSTHPIELVFETVPYDHLVAGHKQEYVFEQPYEAHAIGIANYIDEPISNISVTISNNNNPTFFITYDGCSGKTLLLHEGCAVSLIWIPVDGNKKVFKDVLTVSGETATDQVSNALFLKAVQP